MMQAILCVVSREKTVPENSRCLKYNVNKSAVSQFWILIFGEKKTAPSDITIFHILTGFNISKNYFYWGVEKRWKGWGWCYSFSCNISVPKYLLLFRVEWQLPVECSHGLMHRKFLIVRPLKTMILKYTEWQMAHQHCCHGNALERWMTTKESCTDVKPNSCELSSQGRRSLKVATFA